MAGPSGLRVHLSGGLTVTAAVGPVAAVTVGPVGRLILLGP